MARAKPAKKNKKAPAAGKRAAKKSKPAVSRNKRKAATEKRMTTSKPTSKKTSTKKRSFAAGKSAAVKTLEKAVKARKPAIAALKKAVVSAAKSVRAYAKGQKKAIKVKEAKTIEEIVARPVSENAEIAAGEATKFNIGVVHNGAAMAAQEIPYEYGKDRVVLLVVDPRFVFTYWEVRSDSLDEARRRLGGDGKLTLRFYDITSTGVPEQSHYWDVEVFDRLGNWYLRLSHPDQLLCLDIGVKNHAGHFHCIGRSNVMRLPPQSLAKPGPIKWMVVSPDGGKLISDIEEYTDADMALLKKILGPYFYDLLMRGRLASIAGSSVEAVFYDVSLLRGELENLGASPGGSPGGSPWSAARA